MNDLGHNTRPSDSSAYDEICIYCGATDASWDSRLEFKCPNGQDRPKEGGSLELCGSCNQWHEYGTDCDAPDKPVQSPLTFEQELTNLINSRSMENESDTPDYILAEYLHNCLRAFNYAVKSRAKWYK